VEEEVKQSVEQQTKSIALDMSRASFEAIDLMMEESADDSIFSEILSANKTRTEVVKKLYEHARTPDGVRASAANLLRIPVLAKTQIEALKQREKETRAKVAEKAKKESLAKKLQNLGVGEKIKLAQTGNKPVRSLLLADTNKLVVLTALGNPKITDQEVEAVARNRSVVEDALRIIVKNKEWMKSYTIMSAVITNPKTPPGLAMGFVKLLKKRDVMLLSKNKGVCDAVRNSALKIVKAKPK
jgi:hypothetical protein